MTACGCDAFAARLEAHGLATEADHLRSMHDRDAGHVTDQSKRHRANVRNAPNLLPHDPAVIHADKDRAV